MENIVTEKICYVCKEIKPVSNFAKVKYRSGNTGYSSWCKKCHSVNAAKWNKEHPEKFKLSSQKWAKNNPEKKLKYQHKSGRKYRLKIEYGITEDDFNKMMEIQNGVCAICGGDNNGRRLHVDHNHKTKKIRSLLCGKCNRGIGLFEENISLFEKAIEYLRMDK